MIQYISSTARKAYIHCKKWVVILTIRYGYLSCNIAIFCNYELPRGIGYP